MSKRFLFVAKIVVPILIAFVVFLLLGGLQIIAPRGQIWLIGGGGSQSNATTGESPLLRGKVANLSWIVGRDCQSGLDVYLKTADTQPDAAVVGSAWIDPTNGKLINGESNSCVPGSLSMDNVVPQIHEKGGMAYLTLTMATDGSPGSWTARQQDAYIEKATTTPEYVDNIVREVQRLNYDGVIMDLESASANYPNIQQLFATLNQRIWAALKPLNKPYGIALVHKLSDHDDYYYLNGFQDWRLLAHSADFLVIMALDQSYRTPGPTVSPPWLKQLLAYAQQTMPDMLTHIVWELPLYGATWYMKAGSWVFDGGVEFQGARDQAASIPPSQVVAAESDLNDPIEAHLVYFDGSGVKHSLWYLTAQNLYTIISAFQQTLAQVPQLKNSHLQIAMWYRKASEPTDVCKLLVPLLPN